MLGDDFKPVFEGEQVDFRISYRTARTDCSFHRRVRRSSSRSVLAVFLEHHHSKEPEDVLPDLASSDFRRQLVAPIGC
jgi:hypothetical protein